MTTKTITKGERTIEIVEGEIRSLSNLIEKRNEWLNDEVNRKRTTWDAVKKDTVNMGYTLQELKEELNELSKNE